MTQPEFLSWWAFHELYPFDDFSRFHRPAALIANSFAGRDIKASLQWLMAEPKQAPAPGQRHYSDVELSLIRAIGGSSKTVISKASRKKKG